jgi:hypothetical protein
VFGCVSARRAFAGYHASGSTAVIAVILAVILDDIDARDCSYCERVSVIVGGDVTCLIYIAGAIVSKQDDSPINFSFY